MSCFIKYIFLGFFFFFNKRNFLLWVFSGGGGGLVFYWIGDLKWGGRPRPVGLSISMFFISVFSKKLGKLRNERISLFCEVFRTLEI